MSKHELVVPHHNLPAWLYLHNDNQSTFIESHWHSSVELSYTIKGKIDKFVISDKSYETYPGKILVVNTMEVHSIRTYRQPDGEAEALTVIFPYPLLKNYFPDISHFKIVINDVFGGASYKLLQKKLEQLATLYAGNDNLRKSILILEILEILLKNFLVKRKLAMTDKHDDKQKERLNMIKTYLEENYRAEISLDDVAEYCFLF